MKKIITLLAIVLVTVSCSDNKDCDTLEQEIRNKYQESLDFTKENDASTKRYDSILAQMNREIRELDCN